METEKDKQLWRIAKKRVSFKRHFATYVVVNSMLWLIWYLSENDAGHKDFPWPVWPMFGWGIGLLFSYLDAYVFSTTNAVEKEFEKLKNRQS